MADTETLSLAADIVAAHVSHNSVSAADLPALIRSVHAALEATAKPAEPEMPKQEPAVAIRSSVKQGHIVCLEDGKKLKMLKRYLRTNYDMIPDEYRTKWGLPRDYPMVAPAYAEQRRSLAQKTGLGRKKASDAAASVADAVTDGVAAVAVAEAAGVASSKKRGPAKAKKDTAASDAPVAEPKRRGRPRKSDAAPEAETPPT